MILGLYLTEQASDFKQTIGRGLLAFAPILMKTLSIVGTVAMFLVGGGIITSCYSFCASFHRRYGRVCTRHSNYGQYYWCSNTNVD